MPAFHIIPFSTSNPRHAAAFRAINESWITHHFVLEPCDVAALSAPQAILHAGGAIFLAVAPGEEGAIIGAVALCGAPAHPDADPTHAGMELAKMGVLAAARGGGVGRALCAAALACAAARGAAVVDLLSNRALAPALALYGSLGFREAPLPPSNYARANIYMRAELTAHAPPRPAPPPAPPATAPPPAALVLDLDHTVARYRNGQMMALIYACIVRGLVERGVAPIACFHARLEGGGDGPPAPTVGDDPAVHGEGAAGAPLPRGEPEGDFTDAALYGAGWDGRFARRGLCFDARTGDVLQLAGDGRVAAAWHGLRRVPGGAELAGRYPGAWWAHGALQARGKHPDFAALHTFFDAPCALTLAQLVAWEDAARGASPPPAEGYGHLMRAHFPVFDHIFDNPGAFPTGRGGFFGALRARPARFVLRRPALREALLRAREAGTRVVLATNSHEGFARFVLRAALGEDWRSCFCAAVYACQKPAWFAAGVAPLRRAEGCEGEGGGGGAAQALTLAPPPQPCTEWREGCADDLAAALVAAGAGRAGSGGRGGAAAPCALPSSAPGGGVVFAGDHLHGDVAAAAAYGWAAAAVVEELEAPGEGGGPFWGGFLEAAPGVPSFWDSELARHATVTVSDVGALAGLAAVA